MVSALHDGVLTVGEMFSGPGGIGLALNMAKTKLHRFKHVFASDYDQDSCETYKRNVLRGDQHADEVCICEDIRKLDLDTLPPVDGFLYGFPCNDFSLVGETAGLNGSYGKLYTYGVKYLEKNQPLFFLVEKFQA